MTTSDYFHREMTKKTCPCGGRGPFKAVSVIADWPIEVSYERDIDATRLRATVFCECCEKNRVASVLCFKEVAQALKD